MTADMNSNGHADLLREQIDGRNRAVTGSTVLHGMSLLVRFPSAWLGPRLRFVHTGG
jgi:hypothetical protein